MKQAEDIKKNLNKLIRDLESQKQDLQLLRSYQDLYKKNFGLQGKIHLTASEALENLKKVQDSIIGMEKKLNYATSIMLQENEKAQEIFQNIIDDEYVKYMPLILSEAHSMMALALFNKENDSNLDQIIEHCNMSDKALYSTEMLMKNHLLRIRSYVKKGDKENYQKLIEEANKFLDASSKLTSSKKKMIESEAASQIMKDRKEVYLILAKVYIELEEYQNYILIHNKLVDEYVMNKKEQINLDICNIRYCIESKNYDDAFSTLKKLFAHNSLDKNNDYIKFAIEALTNFLNRPITQHEIIKEAVKWIEKIKDNFSSNEQKAKIFLLIGKHMSFFGVPEHLQYLEEAVKLGSIEAYSTIAQTLYNSGHYEDSIQYCNKAIESYDKNLSHDEKIIAQIIKLRALMKLGRYNEDIDKFCNTDTIELGKNPLLDGLKITKAVYKLKQGKMTDEGKEILSSKYMDYAITLEVKDFLLFITFLSKQQQYVKALESIDKYNDEANNPQIQLKKASILVKKGDASKAKEIFNQLINSENISDELKEQAILEIEIIEAIEKRAVTEYYIPSQVRHSDSLPVYQFTKEKIKTHAENLSEIIALEPDNPYQVKALLKSITKPDERQDQASAIWHFQDGEQIESKNVVKVDRGSNYNLYTALSEKLIKKIDETQKTQVFSAMEKFARGDENSTGIKFLKGGGIELKTQGAHGLGDVRLSSDYLVKNNKGELLVIFNHIGDHTDISNNANISKGFSDSILTTLDSDIHEFEPGLLGDVMGPGDSD